MRRIHVALGILYFAASAASGVTYTVTSTADSGAGSLRQAITDANANPGADTIQFNIVGSGVQTITPATPLPPITEAVTIDGYTQPGSSANTNPVGQGLNSVLLIELDGSATAGLEGGLSAGLNAGLNVQAPNVTVRGLVISQFSQGGVVGGADHSNLVVEGCFLNTSPDGLAGQGVAYAVNVTSPNVRIGGLTAAQRNLIGPASIGTTMQLAGLASGVVQGNLVGTDISGTRAIGPIDPDSIGVSLGSTGAMLFGGTDPNAANVIAGVDSGIALASTTTTIQGNFIGVDAAETGIIRGGIAGIFVPSVSTGSVIGGTNPGEGNVIGGFQYGLIFDTPVTLHGNFIGTDTTGTKNFGNRLMGILVSTGQLAVGGIGPGEGNVIAFNGWVGVLVESLGENPIRGNRMFNNGVGGVAGGGAVGIDLSLSATPNGPTANDLGDGDAGANERQNYPILTSAVPEGGGTRVIGTLNSLASTTFDLDFYSNPSCRDRPRDVPQAEFYLGSEQVTTDASGNASFNFLLPTPIDAGAPVTATATDPVGNTSELSPGIAYRISPGVGGPGDTGNQTINGQLFDPAATVTVGGNPIASTFVNETLMRFVGPSLTPGGVYDVTVTNPGGLTGTVRNGYVSRFSDVADGSLFDTLISQLVAGGITVGIGGGNYGPNQNVTRQQMAVFVLKAKYGICYVPPPCVQVFSDVPCSSNFAPWVNQFAAEGITGGCGAGIFCPTNPVRRDQMAVFLLKARYGSTFTPPPCTGVFGDVPCPSTFAPWIELLAAEGITGGCGGGNYCPLNNNTRGQMAAFIVKTFTLP
jgi:hypothetical protein